jgi:predicted MFS family arabinose efflux permease
MSTLTPRTADGAATPERSLLLRNRDFRLLYTGEVAGKFGSSVTALALQLIAIVTLHADPLAVSALPAVAWLPWLLIGLPAGAWVDRIRRRPVMLASAACSLVLYLTVPIAGALHLLTLPQLLLVAFAAGIATVFFQTAYTALLPSVVAESDRAEGNAKLHGSASAAQLLGQSSGGAVAQLFGPVNSLLANTVTFLTSVVCTARIRQREERPAVATRRSLRQDIGEGLGLVLRDVWLRTVLVYGALSNMALMAFQAIQADFLLNHAGLPQSLVGTLIGLTGLGGVLGAAVARRVGIRIGTARAMLLFEIGVAGLVVLVPLAGKGLGMALYLLGGIGGVAGVVAGNVLRATFNQQYIPAELLGRTTATTAVVTYGTIPLGALLGGGLAQAFGLGTAMWISCAGVPLAAAVLLLSPMRKHRDLPDRPMVTAAG